VAKNNKRLVGIKAIADYLDTSQRNVYRWEKELGLPLRRIAGSKGRSVYADIDDLEIWLKSKKHSELERKRFFLNINVRSALLLLSLIIIIVLIILITNKVINKSNSYISSQKFPNPVAILVEGSVAFIKSKDGDTIWSYTADDSDEKNKPYKTADFLDIDNNGTNEVVARKYRLEDDRYYLTLFDNRGNVLWRTHIKNEQIFNGVKIESDFIPLHVKFVRSGDKDIYIVTNWKHRARFLSLISTHDCKGKLISKYVHVGNLPQMKVHDLNNDGNVEIIISGTNNLLNGEGVVGVLPLIGFKGVSPPYSIEPEYSHLAFWLQSYIADRPEYGNQLEYLRFKRTKHLESYDLMHIFPELDNVDVNLIHILFVPWVLEEKKQTLGFQYVFDFKFNLLDVVPDPYLRKYFPSLQKEGAIDITLEELLDVYGRNVYRWNGGQWILVSK